VFSGGADRAKRPSVVRRVWHPRGITAESCGIGTTGSRPTAVARTHHEEVPAAKPERLGLEAIALPRLEGEVRVDYDTRLADTVAQRQPDWVVLAGWMRILTMKFLGCFPDHVINIHPALPGEFPGTNAIERAFDAGCDHTGVMIHLVPDEGVDNGPVLGTTTVLINPGDSLELLRERMHHAEHELLVTTITHDHADRVRSYELLAEAWQPVGAAAGATRQEHT